MKCAEEHCEKMAERYRVVGFHCAGDMRPSCGDGLVGRPMQFLVVNSYATSQGAAYVDGVFVHAVPVVGKPYQYRHHHHPYHRPFPESLQALYAHVVFHTVKCG